MTHAHRIASWLVRRLPDDFRGDFGGAIEADLAALPALTIWTREIPGLLVAILREGLAACRADLVYGLRALRRSPRFSGLAVVMLALGTGVNVTLFSVINAVMFRSPFPHSDRLVLLLYNREGKTPTAGVPQDAYERVARRTDLFSSVAALSGGGPHLLTNAGDPRALRVQCVSASMFDVLGTPPALGRAFTAADDRAGAALTIVLSDHLWRSLGGEPALIGRTLTINDRSVTALGVMPPTFGGPNGAAGIDAWMPLDAPAAGHGSTGCARFETLNAYGRLREPIAATATAAPSGFTLRALAKQNRAEYETPFLALSAASLCVFLIACANVGGLQAERTLARRRELEIRRALGARHAQLVRLVLVENLCLAGVGTGAGLMAAWLLLDGIAALLPPRMMGLRHLAIDGRAMTAALALAAVCAGVAAVAPILQLRRERAAGSDRGTTRAVGGLRRALVVGEIALSTIVLIAAGLMMRTFLTLRPTHTGFEVDRKLITEVSLSGRSPEQAAAAFDELVARASQLDGVATATTASYLPMSGTVSIRRVLIDGQPVEAYQNYVRPNYFATMQIPIIAGRTFAADAPHADELDVVVNDAFARRMRPDASVVGLSAVTAPTSQTPSVSLRIIGVIADVRDFGFDTHTRPELYFADTANRFPYTWLIASVSNDAAVERASVSIKDAVRQIGPDVAIAPVSTLRALLDGNLAQDRFGMQLLSVFAGLALTLAAIGLSALLSWRVRLRRREIGVRIALGATHRGVTWLIARDGFTLAALGIACGIAAAAGLTRYMSEWIYGVTPLDPLTFAGAIAGMLTVAAATAALPARAASRVDPATALRIE